MTRRSIRARLAAQTLLRVDEVYDLIVAGMRRPAIVRYMHEKHDVEPRTVDKYIGLARDLLEADAKPRRSVELGKALARFDRQYAKADARKDHRGAASIAEKVVDLLGLAAPRKAEITLRDMSLAELDAEIARLEAKVPAADDDAAHDG
jgi:hypothetical protein